MAFNTTKVWKTVAYTCLSREAVATKNGERAESESVVNQQQIIGNLIAAQPDLVEHMTFIDDGATGTNFDGTGFQSMIKEVYAGNINCGVMKKKNGKVYVNYRCRTYTAYSHDACTKHTIPMREIRLFEEKTL